MMDSDDSFCWDDEADCVNHPPHYNSGRYETIDIIESVVDSMGISAFEGVLLGNVIKYITRYRFKNGVEDLNKARWYLDKLIAITDEKTK